MVTFVVVCLVAGIAFLGVGAAVSSGPLAIAGAILVLIPLFIFGDFLP
jgi:hypothetical protein